MKSSRFILLVCSFSVLALTACQPTNPERSSHKTRVSPRVRSKIQFDFKTGQAIDTAAGETPADGTTPAAGSKTSDTALTNALCNAGAFEACEGMRVNILENGDFEGINRAEAANVASAKTLTVAEARSNSVSITYKFEAPNKGVNLFIVGVGAGDVKTKYEEKIAALALSNVEKEIVSADADAETYGTIKDSVEASHAKILIIAETQAAATAAKTASGLTGDITTLVVAKDMPNNVLREEVLKSIGTIVPLHFILPHPKARIKDNAISVTLGGRQLALSTDYGTDIRTTNTTLKILLKKRPTAADTELKITYTLK